MHIKFIIFNMYCFPFQIQAAVSEKNLARSDAALAKLAASNPALAAKLAAVPAAGRRPSNETTSATTSAADSSHKAPIKAGHASLQHSPAPEQSPSSNPAMDARDTSPPHSVLTNVSVDSHSVLATTAAAGAVISTSAMPFHGCWAVSGFKFCC